MANKPEAAFLGSLLLQLTCSHNGYFQRKMEVLRGHSNAWQQQRNKIKESSWSHEKRLFPKMLGNIMHY